MQAEAVIACHSRSLLNLLATSYKRVSAVFRIIYTGVGTGQPLLECAGGC